MTKVRIAKSEEARMDSMADDFSGFEGLEDDPRAMGQMMRNLAVVVYPLGVTREGVLNLYDLAGAILFSVKTSRGAGLQTPRPLAMVMAGDGVRLYRGRNYVLVELR